jgi:hypothetical protein
LVATAHSLRFYTFPSSHHIALAILARAMLLNW